MPFQNNGFAGDVECKLDVMGLLLVALMGLLRWKQVQSIHVFGRVMPRNLFKPSTFTTLSTGTRTEEDSWDYQKRRQAKRLTADEIHQRERKRTAFRELVLQTARKHKKPVNTVPVHVLEAFEQKVLDLPGIINTVRDLPLTLVREFEAAFGTHTSASTRTGTTKLGTVTSRQRETRSQRKQRVRGMKDKNQTEQ